jgi:hypothetical protein
MKTLPILDTFLNRFKPHSSHLLDALLDGNKVAVAASLLCSSSDVFPVASGLCLVGRSTSKNKYD